MTKPMKWYITANPSQGALGTQPQASSGGRRIIPFEKIHRMAKESRDGGRAQCFYCKDTFSMTYMRPCKVTTFQTEFVCGKCRHEKGIRPLK